MNDTMDEGARNGAATAPTAPIAASFGQFLMRALTDTNIPADKLEIILKARKDMLTDEAKEAYQAAYAAFHAECPQVDRDGTVDLIKDGKTLGRYAFTTYEQMDKILRPLLAKHGLAPQFASSDADKDAVKVTGWLLGHGWRSEPSSYTLPPDAGPGRNALQARGSSRRYAKRYILDDLCNIVRKGKDNDGRGAIDNWIDAVQERELVDLLKATGTEEGNFLKVMVTGAERLGDIKQRDFPRLVLALKDRQAKQKAAQK